MKALFLLLGKALPLLVVALFAAPYTLYAQISLPFRDAGRFEYIKGKYLPSSQLWISSGVEVVDGGYTFQPPAPQGKTAAENLPAFTLNSPVLRLNRLGLNGEDRGVSQRGGDTLTSYPIDLRGKYGSVLSLSCERVGRPPHGSYDRGWSDSVLVGPEPRVVLDADLKQELAEPDELIVEFAVWSLEGEVPESAWSRHPRANGKGYITDNPAYTLFGAGGYRRGFAESNKDSSLTREQGLRANLYDDGKDDRFHKIFIAIPDWVINAPEEGAKYFRFRLRVNAANNHPSSLPVDDADDFYVDNIQLLPADAPDPEICAQTLGELPVMSLNQSLSLPLKVVIANNTSVQAPAFAVQLIMRPVNADVAGAPSKTYYRDKTVPFLSPMTEATFDLPTSSPYALDSPHGYNSVYAKREIIYGLTTRIGESKYDSYGDFLLESEVAPTARSGFQDNDAFYLEDTLTFGNDYGYDDPAIMGKNNVSVFTGQSGQGIHLPGQSSGDASWPHWISGKEGEVSGGWIAVKYPMPFNIFLYGIKAFMAGQGHSKDSVEIALFRDKNGVPDTTIPLLIMKKERGYDDVRRDYFSDEYITYLAPGPIKLLPLALPFSPNIWVAVRQLENTSLELGASAFGAGMITTSYSTQPDKNIVVNLDKKFRQLQPNGTVVNSTSSLYLNTGDTVWKAYTPQTGDPGFAHLDRKGSVGNYSTYSRGTWIPMIRPVFASGPVISDEKRECGSYSFTISGDVPTTFAIEEPVNVEIKTTDLVPGRSVRAAITLIDQSKAGTFRVKVVNTQATLDQQKTIPGNYGAATVSYERQGANVRSSSSGFIVKRYDALVASVDGARYYWYRDGLPLPGAYGKTIYPTQGGKYAVEVENTFGCRITSSVYDFTMTRMDTLTCLDHIFPIELDPAGPHLEVTTDNADLFIDTAKAQVMARLKDESKAGSYSIRTTVKGYTFDYSGRLANPPKIGIDMHPEELTLERSSTGNSYTSFTWNYNGTSLLGLSSFLTADKPGEYTAYCFSTVGIPTGPDTHLSLPCPRILGPILVQPDICDSIDIPLGIVENVNFYDSISSNVHCTTLGSSQKSLHIALPTLHRDGWYAFSTNSKGVKKEYMGRIFHRPEKPVITLDKTTGQLVVSSGGDFPKYQWYKDDKEISGATNDFYKPLSGGHYSVTATSWDVSGCSATSEPYDLQLTDVHEDRVLSDVTLDQSIPNPAGDHAMIRFTVHGEQTVPVHLALYDCFGREVLTLLDGMAEPGDNRITVPLQKVTSGVYYYRLETSRARLVRQMLVIK